MFFTAPLTDDATERPQHTAELGQLTFIFSMTPIVIVQIFLSRNVDNDRNNGYCYCISKYRGDDGSWMASNIHKLRCVK